MSQALCPETLFDAIDAREITSSIWEEQLFRKMSQKLIDSNRFKAFENLLINNADQLIGKQRDWIKTIENGRCPDGMTEAEALKKAGLSLVLRQATTVIMAQEDIPQFERLIDNRVKARTTRLKEYGRRKKIRARILKNNPKGSS